MLIKEYSETFELLIVEITVGNKDIRVISGYGPQESWPEEDRMPFFMALEDEIVKAELLGKSVMIEMDANSKLGSDWIADDPHNQTPNGRVLAGILERHNLIVVNSLKDKCSGVITRTRVTTEGVEASVIDFVIVSNDLVESINSLLIDEERLHVLVKYSKTKKKESDHNVLVTSLKMKWSKREHRKKIELFNLKNIDCQKVFKEITSNTNFLSSSFESEKDLNSATKVFLKRLNTCLHRSFRKIKVKDKPNGELNELFSKRKHLRSKDDDESKAELKKVEDQLADMCAEENKRKILDEISGIECEKGGVHSGKLWKLRKKLFPKSRDPPTAMMDEEGNLITCKKKIEDLTLDTYKKRLANRPIKSHLSHLKSEKENLCSLRLDIAKGNKTADWTMDQLDIVLKSLKINTSRDPMGFANELFKPGVAGDDLKKAILMLMNRIKKDQCYPDPLEVYNITSIWKLRGSRNDFDNYRGIFRVPVFRCILDSLIYNDEYPTVDNNLTDSNVGARKGRNIIDNIFVF